MEKRHMVQTYQKKAARAIQISGKIVLKVRSITWDKNVCFINNRKNSEEIVLDCMHLTIELNTYKHKLIELKGKFYTHFKISIINWQNKHFYQ